MVQPGEKFGNYEVLSNPSGAAEVLGSGSGGTTLKVKHVHLDTVAALKILRRRAQADSRQGQSFLAEARSAASLTHPHIARILDFGENAGLLYYVMDLCEGGSLEDFRTDQKWPEYREYCDRLFFAVAPAFPREILPADTGLIVADRYGGDILRAAPEHRLAGARRKAMTLRLVHTAAHRLQAVVDPDGGFESLP